VMLGVTLFFQKRIHPIFVSVRRKNSEISSRLAEYIQAVPILQAYQRQDWALRRFFAVNVEKYETQIPGERYVISWWNLIFMTQTLAFALILGVGGYWALAGLVTIGTLAMFIEYVRRFFEPLMRLSEQLAVIQRAFASAERIFRLLAEPIRVEDPAKPRELTTIRHSITFEHVWFRYRGEGDWILKDLDFTIRRGESIALVGPTGSGKTTLVGLMLRFYDPQRGRVLIDGVDIREFRRADLRGLVGMVQQEIYLFPGTLGENLRLGRDRDEESLLRAARETRADRFIQRLPDGWDTRLAERGVNLSLGQRQQLSLMRALLRDPELVILDEATSAIDPATEAALVEATRKVLHDRTALVIAHRLSTIRDCDRILVLQHGELVQRGTWDELLENEGLFQTMHDLQLARGESREDVA
jgi:ATP-binding cassette, subfamily B, multidrug efflux pump